MESKFCTVVTFVSDAFNMTELKSYFINPGCFGDDVAKWLIDGLRKQGLSAEEEPGQEDFGWYLNFETAGVAHTLVIGHRPTSKGEAGTWFGVLERNCGFPGSLFGGRKRGIQPSAADAIHRILSSSQLVRDVRWHFKLDFDKGASSPRTDL